MSMDNAKSTLKILGILCIILAVFGIIGGILIVAGGSLVSTALFTDAVATAEDAAAASTVTGLLLVAGVITLVSGVIELLEGIFSVRASNDFSKIQPAYIFSIVGLALAIISLILDIVTGLGGTSFDLSTIIRDIVAIVFNGCIFYAAKTIKDNA